MNALLASTSAISGLVVAILTVATAFGAHITPDQHTAIEGLIAALLVIVGLWFHPSVPGGATKP